MRSTAVVVQPPHLARLLFRSSFLATGSIASALYNAQLDCGFAVTLVFLSSVNYWRLPVGLPAHPVYFES